MFYNEKGELLHVSYEGDKNIIYVVSNNNLEEFMKKVNGYKDYWSQKRPCIGCNEYSDSDYFKNLADTYASNSYDVIAGIGYNGDAYVFGSINAPWYMYAGAGLSIMAEGFAAGYNSGRAYQHYGKWPYEGLSNHYNSSLNYGITSYWRSYFSAKTFEPWW